MNYCECLIVKLICDNLGEDFDVIVEENHEKGWIQLEKQDYVQVVLKLEATFDICTGLLEREDCRIYISEIAKLIDRGKLVH